MTDSLTMPAAKDGFTSESPIRAFTEFRVDGMYAIGKGFRPSVGHLSAYLTALQEREGWMLVQIIGEGPLTAIFRRTMPPLALTSAMVVSTETSAMLADLPPGRIEAAEGGAAYQAFKPFDDPINPAHYDGTACADIGELLSPNAYQILKYVWRLGKKDDVCVELGKAIWYARREVALIREGGNVLLSIPHDEAWFEHRIKDRSTFTQSIARGLWQGYNRGMEVPMIQAIGQALKTEKARIECAPGSAL